jgi:hypothetical protein
MEKEKKRTDEPRKTDRTLLYGVMVGKGIGEIDA